MSEVQAGNNTERPMSRREWERYNELKEEVAGAITAAFYTVGKAIKEITRDKLYREEFKSIEQCCQSLFDIGRHRARQLAEASDVYENLLTIVNKTKNGEGDIWVDVLPKNEAQIRPLLAVPEQDRPMVWAKTVESAPHEKVTSGHVNKVVKKYLGEAVVAKVRGTQSKVDQSRLICADMKAAMDKLLEEIRKAKAEGYKTSSRLAITMSLDGIRSIVADDGDQIADRISMANREKLLKAGYTFFRKDMQRLVIEKENNTLFDWQFVGDYTEADELHLAYQTMINESNTHLVD